MIPSTDILEMMEFPPETEAIDEENVFHVIQFVAWRVDAWSDPYFLLKKRCPPTTPPLSVHSIQSECRYLSQVFPLDKIKSVSFERPEMSNLFIDDRGRLMQLLFKTESTQQPKEWYEYITVTEYHSSLWMFLARSHIKRV